ncbi:MAG TPA: O-methyltransferase [Verrucomicrobiae bacterium]|jgi:predicted O-methyltransferase YrrM
MNQEKWTAVDDYINGLFVAADPIMDAVLQNSRAAGLPEINVAPNQGKLLQLLAQSHGARSILEIGTLGGYSTIWLARALPADGKLVTLEFEPKHAEIAQANFKHAGFADQIELHLGKASDSLARLVAEKRGPFDFIFIDADKESYPEYLTWALKLARRGTVIIADNLVRKGDVLEANHEDPRVHGARRFNELLASDPRVTATLLQTVGSKGYDGFAMAIVIK